MRVAIHQPNLIPWFPFFYKMAMVDQFILLKTVQFEKGGYQNRFKYKDKWITKPIHQGTEKICQKDYIGLEGYKTSLNAFSMGEHSLSHLNTEWIRVLAATLNIKTHITDDFLMAPHPDDPTEKLISIIQAHHRGKIFLTYVTNPEAKDKYLDEQKMKDAGINIEYCVVPKHLQISIFEAFEKFGIEGTIKQLPKREIRDLCKEDLANYVDDKVASAT